ncbi:MAG: DUF4412 domain-containing protein [bacterium]
MLKMKTTGLILSIMALILLWVASPLAAKDFFIKQKVHTDAYTMMGQKQPEQNETQTVWMSDTKLAILGEEHSMIMDFAAKTITTLNHQDKTYMVMNLDQQAASEENAQMQQMMKQMMGNMEVTVTPTNEHTVINNLDCQKYKQTMSIMGTTVNAELWAAPEVKPPASNYKKLQYASYLMLPGMESHQDKLQSEFNKIEGLVIKSEAVRNVMGQEIKSWSEEIEYGTKNAPASVFQIPSDYTKKERKMGMPQ